jgi:hypothetical protein
MISAVMTDLRRWGDKMKIWVLLACAALVALPVAASARSSGGGHYYGGGHHTGSHGGTYIGGSGSSHRGGHYVGPYGGYGRHK